ncbi:hypothetical protein ACU635_22830 [[Actinomadura] parvosata]|uniref:hypothetical protein n=1 Tax=[Actinomadura] parvosata TaxID=1955412 RepID=UPI00406C9762
MRSKVLEYLPFVGIVLAICTASWVAGRMPVEGRAFADGLGRTAGPRRRTISR